MTQKFHVASLGEPIPRKGAKSISLVARQMALPLLAAGREPSGVAAEIAATLCGSPPDGLRPIAPVFVADVARLP